MNFNKYEKIAYDKGCRVINEKIISSTGNERKFDACSGYPKFSITTGSRTDGSRKHFNVSVHRLVAYQKYGDKIYEEGIEVRHLDGNTLNFSEDNISIGTHSENMLDIPQEKRKEFARNNVKFSDMDVIAIKKYHSTSQSYKDTMAAFNIVSKGTLWYILNKR